jgi:hypothetical protein
MSIDLMFKQANAAYRAGDFAGAERRYRALTRLKPGWAFHNLGALYVATRRFAEAEAAFQQALAADPANADSRHSLGMLLMGDGRYAEGWPLMEARRQVPALKIVQPTVGCPEWRGEDLAGKRLLVYPEQGFGDHIQYFRLLLKLAECGVQVTLVCPVPLVRLFEGRGVAIVAWTTGCRIPDGDYWTLISSVGLHIGLTLDNIPTEPYLAVAGSATGGVGVVVKGSPTHLNDRNRSLPPKAAAQLAGLGRSLAPEDTGAGDFRDTAEIVAGLDVVISVDTAVVHLAGAMGKPVWVLLPSVETDWRWLRSGRDSPWYPSARLYRQARPGDWAPVLREVAADLAAFRAASA